MPVPLSTACPTLDALLDGGLEEDAITLVFGEGGSGKTNLALQCAREVIAAGKKVAYVDTEGVSPRRMAQVFDGLVDAEMEEILANRQAEPIARQRPDIDEEVLSRGLDEDDPGDLPAFGLASELEAREFSVEGRPEPASTDDAPTLEELRSQVAVDSDGRAAPPLDATRLAREDQPGEESTARGLHPSSSPGRAAGGEAVSGALPESPPEKPLRLDTPSMMDRILFFSPFDIMQQERMVQRTALLKDLGLIVVDSINMHYRLHIDEKDKEKEASRSLYKQLHHLTNFSRQHHVPVLVTGQVYGGEDSTQPFARRTMEHLVKALVRFEKRPDGTRRATVLKHRSIEDGRQVRFKIGPHGLEAVD